MACNPPYVYRRPQLRGPTLAREPVHGWLRGVPPEILRTQSHALPLANLSLAFGMPASSSAKCPPDSNVPQAFNPAIVEAPATLCPRCAAVVGLMVLLAVSVASS